MPWPARSVARLTARDHDSLRERAAAQLIEAESGKCEAAAEGGQGLAENGILLALQLRQQAGKSGSTRLVDSAGRNQLVDERLDALSAERGQRGHRNVVQIESVGNMQADVAGEVVADLVDLDIE